MKIHLPNSAFLGNIDPFLQSFNPSNNNKLEITANKKWISIHPIVLVMVASLGLNINLNNIVFEHLEATSKHYLERIGLFKILGLKSKIKITEHESAGRFIPITQIKTSDELTNFIKEIVPLLHLEPKQAEPIKYVISELVRNVLEHADAKNGAIVCAQYYKKSNTIRIGIADTGVGIKKSINFSYPTINHLEALKLALTPGITGTTKKEGGTEQNAGAGLFFIKSIAKTNRDFFVIYSGNAMYKLLKSSKSITPIKLHADPFEDKHAKRSDLPLWQGTVVGIDLSLNVNTEFSHMLDLIRETYVKTIKERKAAKYKRPRFI